MRTAAIAVVASLALTGCSPAECAGELAGRWCVEGAATPELVQAVADDVRELGLDDELGGRVTFETVVGSSSGGRVALGWCGPRRDVHVVIAPELGPPLFVLAHELCHASGILDEAAADECAGPLVDPLR